MVGESSQGRVALIIKLRTKTELANLVISQKLEKPLQTRLKTKKTDSNTAQKL